MNTHMPALRNGLGKATSHRKSRVFNAIVLLLLSLVANAHGAWAPLHTWYSPGRGDHSTTSEPVWQGAPGEMRSPDYRFVRDEGRAVTPDLPQPPDTVGLYGWYSPSRGDNWTTTQWPGTPEATLSPDYEFFRLHGYAYSLPLAGTVPLNSWWSGPRGDNRVTSDPLWRAGLPGPDPGNGYGFVRTEGYVVRSPNQPPFDPAYFGYRTMTVNGRLARGTRPLLAIMVRYSDQDFYSPHSIAYYRDLIFGGLLNSAPNVNGYFHWNSRSSFRWSDAGVILINMPDDASTPGIDESTFAYWDGGGAGATGERHGRLVLQAASQQINFATFDTDGDDIVEQDELVALTIHSDPPPANCGQTRGHESFTTDGKKMGIVVSAVAQGAGLGTIVHELFHALGTDHTYGNPRINSFYSAMAATCNGQDIHQYFHADAWHKMRLGWEEPRIFAVNGPGSSDYLTAPQYYDWPDGEGPIVLFDPTRQTSAGKEYFLLEYRRPTTGTVDNYDRDVPGTGLVVWWARTGPGSDEFIHFKKILPGPNGTFQTSIPAGSDDRLVDTNNDGRGDQIQPGRDFVLQSQSVLAGDDTVADDPGLILYGAPNRTWGTGRPWTSADGDIRLRYYDGTDSGIVVRVGKTYEQGNVLAVEWRREPVLLPRIDIVTPHALYSCNRLWLAGVFPVDGPTRVNLISATGVVRECETDPINTDLRNCLIRLPNDTPAGDYEIEMLNGTTRGNRIRYRLNSSIGRPAGTFSFDRRESFFFESNPTANFTILRNDGTCGPVTLRCEVTGVTATIGRDFSAPPIPLIIEFQPGQSATQFSIPILQDSVSEATETVLLTLISASGGGILGSSNRVILSILDDDPLPDMTLDGADITEGDDTSVFVEVPITLSAPSERLITVPLFTTDGNARAGLDYRPTNVTVTIPAGLTRVTHRLEILPDRLDEFDEQFVVEIGEANGAVSDHAQRRVTIHDNDPEPVLFIQDTALTEDDEGTRNAVFGVFLSEPSGKAVSFSVETESVTALAGEDFEAMSLAGVTLAPGETGTLMLVRVTGRPGHEPDETFLCRLSSPNNNTIARAEGICTIKELRFHSIKRDGSDIVLTLPSCRTERYHILKTRSLEGPASAIDWLPLTPRAGLNGTGTTLTFRDVGAVASDAQHFYRIRSEQDFTVLVP